MSINSQCFLPSDIRPEDLVRAIAYLCGAKRITGTLQNGGVFSAIDPSEVNIFPKKSSGANKVYVQPTYAMGYYTISVAPTTCDHEWHEASLFIYPGESRKNRILLYAGVSDFWHSVERALVDFFGGEVDYNDCDLVDVDYKRRKPRKSNCPEDGDEWDNFQRAMLNLPTLFQFVEEK